MGGPGVRHDMVQREQQHLFVRLEADETDPQERPVSEIEWTLRLDAGQPDGSLVTRFDRKMLQVDHRHGQRQRGSDHLHRHSIETLKRRTQRFMAPDDFVETPFQGCDIERSGDAQGDGNVVGHALRIQLRQHPQAFLCEGKRERTGSRPGLHGRRLVAPRDPLGRVDHPG